MKKIAYDLHGVLNPSDYQLKSAWPEEILTDGLEGTRRMVVCVFKKLLVQIKSYGNEVWVISGPIYDDVKEELTTLGYMEGIHYDHIGSVVSFLMENKARMWQDEDGNWWSGDGDWWSSKAIICSKNKIDLMIDDHEEYGRYFDTGKFRLWEPEKWPKMSLRR